MRIVYILFFILFVLMLVLGGERGAKSFITLVCNVFIGAISIFPLNWSFTLFDYNCKFFGILPCYNKISEWIEH